MQRTFLYLCSANAATFSASQLGPILFAGEQAPPTEAKDLAAASESAEAAASSGKDKKKGKKKKGGKAAANADDDLDALLAQFETKQGPTAPSDVAAPAADEAAPAGATENADDAADGETEPKVCTLLFSWQRQSSVPD